MWTCAAVLPSACQASHPEGLMHLPPAQHAERRRCAACRVIVHFHRPAYTSTLGAGDIQEASDLRSAFEDVFVEYQVWNRSCWGLT